MHLASDSRIVMTLDAGGTNLRFAAMRGGKPITHTVSLPTTGNDLAKCLAHILDGFTQVKALCPEPPSAISFAFPGPADYPNGIIGDLRNLTGFRGGVALGPMLEEKFTIPVFINNDGDLFAYGEAIGGLLPHINSMLENAGSPKRYQNLFGLTLGTGLGGGIVRKGELFTGDNSMAGEIWLLRNKLHPAMNAEEGACIRAVRRVYAELSTTPLDEVPAPKQLCEIASGTQVGNQAAAVETFRRLGETAGDALGNALTLIDGLAVIGGGISGAWPFFLPALVGELNRSYTVADGSQFRRLASAAFNLEDPVQLEDFLKGETRTIQVPGSDRSLLYDPLQRIGVGVSRLGTSEAISLGAYAFALQKLDQSRVFPAHPETTSTSSNDP
jgi:glucokinase